ncbi:ATP-grasp domain-containing protein [Qipengyuania atrilutea]|uniref:ATP-grasp domain-containing protein n=1 Tax=Qipengyuania atrilutea TaxID=2744473 RepID=A0A850H5Z3_9SPHN|nr:hypothetical protein [Actirhodobacter atriluteus]NVD45582.1 hypothetical protein [Actirhodobacter atriluteus]
MTRIIFLACHNTLTDAPQRRPDAFEHDYQLAALQEGLAAHDLKAEELDWRAPIEDFAGADAILLGTAWDYQDHAAEFAQRLEALEEAGAAVFNPATVVRWNMDKGYLRELAERGVPTIPTHWADNAGPDDLAAAFEDFETDRIVVKRRIGAGGEGQSLIHKADPAAHDFTMDRPALIQPFLPSIAEEGEYSFIFIDGVLSHTLVKRAAAGDYRIQSSYGGTESVASPNDADAESAEKVVNALPFHPPLYARIDMVRGEDGGLFLMEAELIEPYLFPVQGPELGPRLADAIVRRLEKA